MKTILITFLILISVGVLSSIKVLAADTYPYPTAITCDEGCQADPWGFYKRQCTSYAAWKVNESGVTMTNWMQGPNGKSGIFGNAETWDNNAFTIGVPKTTVPQTRAVAQWEAFHGGAGSAGHVAFVESLNSDGSANISEYNFATRNGYGTRNNVRADNYIIFGSTGTTQCGGSQSQISNYTVGNGSTFTCVSNQQIKLEPEFKSENGSNSHFYTN